MTINVMVMVIFTDINSDFTIILVIFCVCFEEVRYVWREEGTFAGMIFVF